MTILLLTGCGGTGVQDAVYNSLSTTFAFHIERPDTTLRVDGRYDPERRIGDLTVHDAHQEPVTLLLRGDDVYVPPSLNGTPDLVKADRDEAARMLVGGLGVALLDPAGYLRDATEATATVDGDEIGRVETDDYTVRFDDYGTTVGTDVPAGAKDLLLAEDSDPADPFTRAVSDYLLYVYGGDGDRVCALMTAHAQGLVEAAAKERFGVGDAYLRRETGRTGCGAVVEAAINGGGATTIGSGIMDRNTHQALISNAGVLAVTLVDVTEDGDRATARVDGSAKPVRFRRVEGAWLIDAFQPD